MIVLSRQRDETVMIGKDLLVTVVLVRGDRVTLEVEDQLRSNVSQHELERDQEILLRDGCRVCIVDIRGEKVRLGIVAARDTPVHRKEVWEAIDRENRTAARVRASDIGHSLTLRAGQSVIINGTLRVRIAAIGQTCVFAEAKGRLEGGLDDGLEIDRVLELSPHIGFRLGTRIMIRVESIVPGEIQAVVTGDRSLSVRVEG